MEVRHRGYGRDSRLTSIMRMIDDALPIPARSETLWAFAGSDARRRVREFPAHPPPLSRGAGEGRFEVQMVGNHLHEDQ